MTSREKLGVVREVHPGERRVSATPDTVGKLIKMGFSVLVERGAGTLASYPDHAFEAAGATLVDGDEAWDADVVIKVNPPEALDEGKHEVDRLRAGAVLVSMVQPAQSAELLERLAARKVSALALDQVPRISRAQKLDVLSSMANIAGYKAVLEASNAYGSFMTGQITAAGKTRPARVLVIGAGVAGLAAIGTARGLGAEVYAFDTREAVKEQVESMGGRFLLLDFEESGEGAGGYAKVMSKEFIDAEMALFREQAPQTDIVITTALIPGRKAPILWTRDMVELMKPGSVVVDLAAANGGNCEVTEADTIVDHQGVKVIGYTDLVSRLPTHASQFYGTNIVHLLKDLGGAGDFALDLEDEVVRAMIVAHEGEVMWPPPKKEAEPRAQAKSATPAPSPPATVVIKEPEKPRKAFGILSWILGTLSLGAIMAAALWAPPEFTQHLTVFVLSVFVGWQVVWAVTPALHTPLMSVTNAISGIIIVGGLLVAGSGEMNTAAILGAVAIFFASINIFGGFAVTHRMLAMFRK